MDPPVVYNNGIQQQQGILKTQMRSQLGSLQQTKKDPPCAESTECAEKVEAMLSTAVLHLADLWNMVSLEFAEGVAFDPDTALLTPVSEIPPVVLTAMKSKLENSLEWCQLARSRLRVITKLNNNSSSSSSSPPSIKQVAATTTTTTTMAHQQDHLLHPGSCNNHNPNHNLWQSRGMGSELKLANFASPSPRSRVGTVQNCVRSG